MIDAAVLSSAKTGGRDDWRTPPEVLRAVKSGWPIYLDPCASSDPADHFASVNVTEAEDGITADWWGAYERAVAVHGTTGGVIFVNWPYSQSAKWVHLLDLWASCKPGLPIIGLCAARPGARWYRTAKSRADAVAEWRGRIKFVGAKHSAPFPSALLAYNLSWRRFAAALEGVADVEIPR